MTQIPYSASRNDAVPRLVIIPAEQTPIRLILIRLEVVPSSELFRYSVSVKRSDSDRDEWIGVAGVHMSGGQVGVSSRKGNLISTVELSPEEALFLSACPKDVCPTPTLMHDPYWKEFVARSAAAVAAHEVHSS